MTIMKPINLTALQNAIAEKKAKERAEERAEDLKRAIAHKEILKKKYAIFSSDDYISIKEELDRLSFNDRDVAFIKIFRNKNLSGEQKLEIINENLEEGYIFSDNANTLWLKDTAITSEKKIEVIKNHYTEGRRRSKKVYNLCFGSASIFSPTEIFVLLKFYFANSFIFTDKIYAFWLGKKSPLSTEQKFELIKIHSDRFCYLSNKFHCLWIGDESGLSKKQKFELLEIGLEASYAFSPENEKSILNSGNIEIITLYCSKVYPDIDINQFME